MISENMDETKQQKLIEYWLEGSEDDWDTMLILFDNNKYVYSLFFLHLSVEKVLKALYVKINKLQAPPIHNLLELIKCSGLILDANQQKFITTLLPFYIQAMYPDAKKELISQTNRDYSLNLINKGKEFKSWILNKLKQ